MFFTLKRWANLLRHKALGAWFIWRDPRTPNPIRLLITLVAAYAISPVDLAPDFIPLLGYLDDLILVPLGLSLAHKLAPAAVRQAAAERAARVKTGLFWVALISFLSLWLLLVWLIARWLLGA